MSSPGIELQAPAQDHEPEPNVLHEIDSRRRHVRLKMPLQVTIDGKIYSVFDWSLGGLQIDGAKGLPGVGGRFFAEISVPFSDFKFGLKVCCEIVWFDAENMRVGCRFIDLRENQVDLLRYLVDAYVSGRIATVDGLLQTAHASPGTGRKLQRPGHGEQEISAPQRIWRIAKTGSIIALFLMLGLGVALLAGTSIYNRLFVVATDLAWVHAPIVPLRATAEGVVHGSLLEPNTGIKLGTQLLRIENGNLQGTIDLTIATLEKEAERLAGLRRQLTERQEFFVEYNELARVERNRAEARVSEAEVALDIARRKLQRAQVLRSESHLPASRLEEEQANFAAATLNLRLAQADLDQSKINAEVADRGYYYTGARVEGGEPSEIERRIRLAEKSVNIARIRIASLRAQQESLLIRSPCDCIVQDTFFVPGMWVERGDLLYRLTEVQDKQSIKALVSQEAVDRLMIGSAAEVHLADRVEILAGQVTAIDRTIGDSGTVGYPNLVPNRHRFAAVTVTLDDVDHISTGLPAHVIFPFDIIDWTLDMVGSAD